MKFVTYQQLVTDIRLWSKDLPPLQGVIGIPRSGMLAASILGLHRNIPVLSAYDLMPPTGHNRINAQLTLRRGNRELSGEWLLLDDTCASGGTMKDWRGKLEAIGWPVTLCGAVYVLDKEMDDLPMVSYKVVDWPRRFEWNIFHSRSAELGLFDIDGVLAEDDDGSFGQQFDPDDPGYDKDKWEAYLWNKKPLYIPTVKVLAVVTSRLERDREVTEAWLKKHGVQYGQLHMSPFESAKVRRQHGQHGVQKGSVYRRYPNTQMFFESDLKQSHQIANTAKRPVLWVGGMQLVTPS